MFKKKEISSIYKFKKKNKIIVKGKKGNEKKYFCAFVRDYNWFHKHVLINFVYGNESKAI